MFQSEATLYFFLDVIFKKQFLASTLDGEALNVF